MKRREFLKAAGTAGLAASTALATPALAQGKRELRMVTPWPKGMPGLGTGAERLAKRITAITEGEITVRVYPAGELVAPFDVFDAVSEGRADLYHGSEYYWQGKSPAFNFFASVPFGLTANEMEGWVRQQGAQKLWDELAKSFGVKPFLAGNMGYGLGGWFKKEIKATADLGGLRIHMPGLGGEVLRRLGATALTLPGGEIYPALQASVIDGAVGLGPWNDMAMGLYKVTKFCYSPAFSEPGTALSLGINLKLWESFTPAQKVAIENATAAESSESLAEFNARNIDAVDDLRTKYKVEPRSFPNSVLNAIGDASGQVLASISEGDALTKKVYTSFIDYRRKAVSWSKHGHQAYLAARLLPFKYGT
jgi:TRAP-type mannitol/chloroaromatic compound transport system substrate-binding protein